MNNINIFGTKGGVGVTTVTTALAFRLGFLGQRVVVEARHGEEDSLAAAMGFGITPVLGTEAAVGVYFGQGDPSETGALPVITDCGSNPADVATVSDEDINILVTRACYLGLRRTIKVKVANLARYSGIVLIEEPGRALGVREVSDVLGRPVIARIPYRDTIARAVDAGVLHALPQPIKDGTDAIIRECGLIRATV